jgi:hypothetical protein
MARFRQLSNGMYGAWRLAHLDPAAMAWFERGIGGVRNSFWGAALAYPGFMLAISWTVPPALRAEAGTMRILLVSTLAYVALRAAFPLVILHFCDWLERGEQSLDLIIAYNWSLVLRTALPLGVILAATALPWPAATLAAVTAVAAQLSYLWFIARTALDAGGVAATAVVLIDLVLAAAASEVAQSLY